MVVIKKENLISKVVEFLVETKTKGADYDNINFIIDRYLHYMKQALIHGHPVFVHRLIKFSLVYTYFDIIPQNLKRVIRFSSRSFGYWFHVIAEASRMDKSGYIYKTDEELLNLIADHNESDIVYKLIKK